MAFCALTHRATARSVNYLCSILTYYAYMLIEHMLPAADRSCTAIAVYVVTVLSTLIERDPERELVYTAPYREKKKHYARFEKKRVRIARRRMAECPR